jgi:Trp operon repressor
MDLKDTVEQWQHIPQTLVAISEDQREQELLTLFRSADERGKHCMVAMARCMPCMRGG